MQLYFIKSSIHSHTKVCSMLKKVVPFLIGVLILEKRCSWNEPHSIEVFIRTVKMQLSIKRHFQRLSSMWFLSVGRNSCDSSWMCSSSQKWWRWSQYQNCPGFHCTSIRPCLSGAHERGKISHHYNISFCNWEHWQSVQVKNHYLLNFIRKRPCFPPYFHNKGV